MLRSIKTEKDIEREESKKRRNKLYIGFALVVLMVMSSVGYAIMSNEKNQEGSTIKTYKNHEFVQQNGVWISSVNGTIIYFNNFPEESENVSVSGNFNLNDYTGKPLYIVNMNNAVSVIITNLNKNILRYQEACLDNMNCSSDLPVKTCDDNLIVFVEGNEDKVWKDKNCVYLSGDLFKAGDAFTLRLFSI